MAGDVAKECASLAQTAESRESVLVRGTKVLELQAEVARVVPDRSFELTQLGARESTIHRNSARRAIA
jgi:hypothetical protein